jgi:hypothetical protein
MILVLRKMDLMVFIPKGVNYVAGRVGNFVKHFLKNTYQLRITLAYMGISDRTFINQEKLKQIYA